MFHCMSLPYCKGRQVTGLCVFSRAPCLLSQMDVMKKVQAKVGSDTVLNLLDRACPRLIDANCIKLLVSKVGFH